MSTAVGIFTARFTGTSINSAWFAIPEPAQATRSPIPKKLTSEPQSTTVPAAEYPRGAPEAAPRIRSNTDATPFSRISSIARSTFSGCRRARRYSGTLAAFTPAISVPTLMHEYSTRTRIVFTLTPGDGTSTTFTPSELVSTCFTAKNPVYRSRLYQPEICDQFPKNADD